MAAPVRVGDVLDNKYEVRKVLGQGAMGAVVAAWHQELHKLVALKFMHEEISSSSEAVERFLREARAASQLTNEHVGRVLDVDRMPNGVPYIVMEYLEGKTLQRVVKERGPLPIADAAEYVLQACDAMAEAHARSIVHRDLKPENLFLTTRPDGRSLVKVLDFGISKVHSAVGMTSSQQTVGSPAYMAPEQIRSSRSVDARADIWSIGVVLYQLLTDDLPFSGDNVHEVMFAILDAEPQPILSVRPGLPPALVAAIDRCLQKERDQRFANVAELAHELVPFVPERARAAISLIERVVDAAAPDRRAPSHDDGVVPETESRASMAIGTTLGSAASSIAASRPPRGSRGRWIVAGGGAVGVLGIAAFVAFREPKREAEEPAASPVEESPPPVAVPTVDAGVVAPAPVVDAAVATAAAAVIVPIDAAAPVAAPTRRTRTHRSPDASVGSASAGSASPEPSLEPLREDEIRIPVRDK